ncbi:Capsular polysaccharide biosynthesis protein [Actinopolymorpha cephalotaxi]|uniref:Capsular polysaccharide biosynthesis protein n=1 Tax=Actinopolymorpha cephalotaxi TaxID=504797 RepID=A0A1I2WT94_9ACTN|nr:hypothetical protein [Actinopolymorpha cephalotaxi]NYH85048.1 capsular polysaccharide biosynthesis protein [Actinopolymorpha cephalotaxi]SFH02811.1 Capsular polysaccharide biosynthesis protein [Actinopolymorpha cephalotaxi]
MDLLDSVNILLRRWMLTVPLLVLTIAGVVAGYFVLPWSYQAQSTVVLLASPYQSKQAGGNPYLLFDGSLTVTAEVVGREVMGNDIAEQLKARKLTSEYEVKVPPDTAGPVLSVEVTGSDRENVRATQSAVTELVTQRLAGIQSEAGVDSQARIRITDVSTTPPTRQAKGKLRTLAMALFAGLVTTIVVPLSAEAMAARRRRTPRTSTGTRQVNGRSPVRPPVETAHPANGWSAPPRATRPTRADHLVRSGRAPVVTPRSASPEQDL